VPATAVTSQGNYTVTVGNLSAITYTLTAAPLSPTQQGDTACAAFLLTQVGTQSVTGTSTSQSCWGST
jgi:Tfp pilus assembly protein PilE